MNIDQYNDFIIKYLAIHHIDGGIDDFIQLRRWWDGEVVPIPQCIMEGSNVATYGRSPVGELYQVLFNMFQAENWHKAMTSYRKQYNIT